MAQHSEKVTDLSNKVAQAYALGKQLKIIRSGGNVTRKNVSTEQLTSIDMQSFTAILDLNPKDQTIDVEPGLPMDVLVSYALRHNLIPPVTPEFPGITVGGAIQGGALESSSFTFGQFNENVIELELVLGDGSCIIASPNNEYADLFWGVSTSYGSLALITRAKLKLIEAKKYVSLEVSTFNSAEVCAASIISQAKKQEADFLEGIIFSNSHAVIISGKQTNTLNGRLQRFRYNASPWYYRFIRNKPNKFTVTTPLYDYLFRYDKGAFWMGEYLFPIFGLSSNLITRSLFAPFLHTRKLYDGLHSLSLSQEFVIQDLYLDEKDIPSVLNLNNEKLGVYPMWLCPIKSSTYPQKLSSSYRLKEEMLLNIGLYGKSRGNTIQQTKDLESLLKSKGSRKMLYAQTYFPTDQFWNMYDKNWYSDLREKYHSQPFRDVYSKVYSGEIGSRPRKLIGILKILRESIQGKNMVWK